MTQHQNYDKNKINFGDLRMYVPPVHPSTRRQRENRDKINILLGGKCAVCGWDDARALELDHIQGGGSRELRKGLGAGNGYYTRVLKHLSNLPGGADSDKYQLLCANHNKIKRVEKQEALGRRQHNLSNS
jgi:hypothetical protein